MADLKKVLIDSIQFPAENVSLRKPPQPDDKDYGDFLNLKSDIANRGILNTFSVRAEGDIFFVVDGSRRATAVKQLHEEGNWPAEEEGMVAVTVTDMDEWEGLASMISGNYNAKKTVSASEIKAINRISQMKNMTMAELAEMCGLSLAYLTQLLKIKYLPENAQAALDAGEMSVTNAIQLTKLPENVMGDEWVAKACAETGEVFTTAVSEAINEIKKQRALDRSGKEPTFEPKAKMMKKEEIIVLYERSKSAFEDDASDYNRGVKEAFETIFQLDEKSVAAAKAEWEQKQADAEAGKATRKAERETKKMNDAMKFLESQGKKVVDSE